MSDAGGSGAIKQEITFSSTTIFSYLEGIFGVSFVVALPPRVAVWASSPVGQVSIEEGLTTNSWQGLTTLEGDTCTIGTAKTGSS